MSLLSESSSSIIDIEKYFESASSSDDSTSRSSLESFLELNRTQEKNLLRKFGIVQSTSTSSSQITEYKDVQPKGIKKRRISASTSFKKTKKPRKFSLPKRSKKVEKTGTKRKLSGTFTVLDLSCSDEKKVDSKETLSKFPDSLLDPDFDDYDANIEHDSIVTKYGLPYDIIQCACYLKDEIFGADENPNKSSNPVCISQSCYDFEKAYGKTNDASKYTKDARKSAEFKAACKIYNGIIRKSSELIDEDEFTRATTLLKVYYPHYWKYISRKDVLYLYEYDITKEKFSKTQLILSCMRLLKEQNLLSKHYRIKMNGLESGVKFNDRLNHNFMVASSFLKREYPNLFVYLIKKYSFKEIVDKKLEIIENRLKLIRRVRTSHKQLRRLDDKYMRT